MINRCRPLPRIELWRALLLSCWTAISAAPAIAQQPVVVSEGKVISADELKTQEARRGRPQPAAAPNQPAQPNPEAKPEGEKKEGEGGEGEKKDAADDSVKRPDKPPRTPDPRELDVALDANGKVPPFNFVGQGWPDVMQWLANLSKCSLDWQELPTGYLNLTTQRAYPLDEVRDLINRQLLARGYTAVQSGELLSVFKLDKLDPSVIKRVTEDELYDLKPYDFVKVTFDVPASMEVDKAKEDIKQVLSPNAKTFPLAATKRILVIDAVANLRMVSALLNEERLVQDGRIVPKEFVLKHARPEQVIDILYVVLGMDPKSRPTQMDLQLQQQKLQIMAQMQQKGTDVSKMLKQDGPPVYLAYNKQRNSVLVNAPPEQMKVIEQTIAYLDVPFGGEGAAESTAVGTTSGERVMRKYPLTTLDPENFINTLQEIGGLSPYTEFKVDKKSKLLFALASEPDHAKIKGLIADFDGSGRDFHVLWLRRLPADAVAATIYNLMAGQADDKEDDDRRRYYDPWSYYGREEENEEPVKGFGVDADIENNRLLLWANEVEMDRVRGLLTKLGEIPDGQQDQRQVRLVQPSSEISTDELMERLRDAWSATSQNELIIKMPEKPPVAPPPTKAEDAAAGEKTDAEPTKDRSAAMHSPRARLVQFVPAETSTADIFRLTGGDAAAAPDNGSTREPSAIETAPDDSLTKAPPVTITVTEDGRIMLSSADPAALDRLEQLIEQLSPQEKRFRVFRLKNISALNMKWNLEDFFADELKGDEDGFEYNRYFGIVPKTGDGGGSGLAKRRKLMISWDTPSNTILVANASPSQMQEIEQLIAEYDRPAPADSVRTRRSAAIKVNYSKASVIADAIKQVYRDLLSSRDKEFAQGEGNERDRGARQERVTVLSFGDSSGNSQRPTPVKVGFEGALSIGVDDVSNMIVVSVQEELFDSVVNLIHTLDQEAAPQTTVQVHRVSGSVTAEALQRAINQAMSQPWLGGKPDPNAARGGRGGRGRGEGEGRGQNDWRGDDRRRDNRGGGGGGGRGRDRRNRDND